LSVEALKNRGLENIGIIFNGKENPSTENIIVKMSGLSIIGRIDEEDFFDRETVKKYAERFKPNLTCKVLPKATL
jgi:dethiobiotin synthetase